MSDPSPDAPRTTPDPTEGRRWPFTFIQVRLGLLLASLAFGLSGMLRNDGRLILVGMAVAVVGVLMRIWNRYQRRRIEG